MIRVLVFLVLTAAFARYVVVWVADHPGDVSITWLGYHWAPPIGVLIGTVAVIACLAVLAWSLLRMVVRAPGRIAKSVASRRAARGQLAISSGLLAIGAGDVRAARKFAAEARRLVADQPLLLLLQAQTAQLAGERDGADAAFRAMTERAETKLFGLHGLFIEAQRRNDAAAARAFAEDAAKASPSLVWAGQAALEFRCLDGDWSGALEALERNRRGGIVDKDTFNRQRAVLLTARALAVPDDDSDTATELAVEAAKLCPGLVPAAVLAARLLTAAGERRKAGRILESAWRQNPHPDLADAYGDLVPGGSARDRLARMRTLAHLAEGHPESALAVAGAALSAHEFAEARASLAPLLAAPTKRVATMMAQLEEAENGDTGRAREWMARAVHAAHDPAWTADGVVAKHWMPVSPVTGRLDAFQWRVPFEDLTSVGPVIDSMPPPRPVTSGPAAPAGIGGAIDHSPNGAPRTPGAVQIIAAAAAELPEELKPMVEQNPNPRPDTPSRAPDDPGPEPDVMPEVVIKKGPYSEANPRSWWSGGATK